MKYFMKISEVCTKTELTEKTVRFYIEKGLLKKEAQIINGRNCRDYSEEDVSILKDISVLRHSGFSIQDILKMQTTEDELHLMLSQQIIMLESETERCQQIKEALKTVPDQENISWRDLARHIRNYNNEELKNVSFRWPEEELMDYKGGCHIPGIFVVFMVILSILLASLSIAGYWNYNRSLTTIITISDVIFEDKWVENGRMFAEISCKEETAIGYDKYFSDSRILEITNETCYDALKLMKTSYSTVTLQIEIPYGVAIQNQLLKQSAAFDCIHIELFLQKPELVKKYCKVVQVIA